MRLLRRMKAEAALLIALADIGGVWPVMRAARALTEVADTAIVAAVRFLLRDAAARGRLKPADKPAPEEGSGHIVLAMGKMGAFELNYSSDIDLIVFYDPDAPALADKDDAAAFHVRITRGLVKLLQERTADGYVFRVDLRLRPDPASTQIAVSTETALNYYGSVGQNWERAAMIKARVCAGDIKAGEDILRQLSPFIWRKYLDFAAVADIEALKRQIHAYRGHADIAVEGHNIKLGRGGIREIEFFVQTQQLVAGGRHPELRGRETLPTLAALAEGGWIGADARADLEAAYLFLRETEHRLQMVADDQTHTLPSDREGLERFARFAGFKDRDAFAETLLGHLRKVQGHYVRLFEETVGRGQPAGADVSQGGRRPRDAQPARRDGLPAAARGLRHGPQLAVRLLPRCCAASSRRSQFADLVPVLLDRLARSENPDTAISAFDDFIAGMSRGARLFSLLRQNPDLVTLVALTLGTAPRLADILARHPEAMDALLEPSFFGALPDEAALDADLARTAGQERAYEDYLDRLRMFSQEQMFLIGARILSGTVSAEQAGGAFARIADVAVRALHRRVEDDACRKPRPHPRPADGAAGARQARRPRDDGDLRPRSHHRLRFRRRASAVRRRAAALRRAVFRAADAAADQRAVVADQLRRALSGRHAAAPVGALRAGRHQHRRVRELSGDRSLDLGAHGADARARGLRAAGVCRARRGDDPRRALPQARSGGDRSRRRRHAAGDRPGEGRERALGSEIRRRRSGRSRVHRAISPAGARRRPIRKSSIRPRRACSTRRGGSIFCRPRMPTCCGRRSGCFHNLTQVLRLCLPGPFDPKTAGTGLLGLLCRAADLPNFATLDAHVADTRQKVRATFNRILGTARE